MLLSSKGITLSLNLTLILALLFNSSLGLLFGSSSGQNDLTHSIKDVPPVLISFQ
jgi:hypothetical protein